jgi:molybdopterin-guanine dinucleotide biosynthesis protein A
MSSRANDILGAIIAGGASSRYGSPKALARVGGVRVVDRVAAALRAALGHDDIFAIVNDAALAEAIALPHRADERPGMGALGGVHAALLHAREHGARAILTAGCDMPFLAVPLLRLIVDIGAEHDAVLPESASRRGVEPLCALYATSCIAPIEAALARGDARMISFHGDIDMHRVPLHIVRRHGDPDLMFMNLNTPSDLVRAEQHAAGPA